MSPMSRFIWVTAGPVPLTATGTSERVRVLAISESLPLPKNLISARSPGGGNPLHGRKQGVELDRFRKGFAEPSFQRSAQIVLAAEAAERDAGQPAVAGGAQLPHQVEP